MEAWRAHPVTEIVIEFVSDLAGEIRERWSQGSDWNEEARVHVKVYEYLADMDVRYLADFYKSEEDEQSEP